MEEKIYDMVIIGAGPAGFPVHSIWQPRDISRLYLKRMRDLEV